MKSPAVVLIPSLLNQDEASVAPSHQEGFGFDPIHPLALKLKHVLDNPEANTIGNMADLIEQLMGELYIMGVGPSEETPPGVLPVPSFAQPEARASEEDGLLSESEKIELGRCLLDLERGRAQKGANGR